VENDVTIHALNTRMDQLESSNNLFKVIYGAKVSKVDTMLKVYMEL